MVIRTIEMENQDDLRNGESVRTNMNQNVVTEASYIYSPSTYQGDIWTGYQGRLRYDTEKMKIDLYRQDSSNMKRLEYEQGLNNLRVQYQTYMQLMSCTVYKDTSGKIIFSIMDSDCKKIASKVLLNVEGYNVKMLVSYHQVPKSVLWVSWGNDENEKNNLFFLCEEDGIDPNTFLKRLKSKGVLMLVSGRTEKKAANALLAYSIEVAERIEIPSQHGWVKMKNNKWHFAYKHELVMKEVMTHV